MTTPRNPADRAPVGHSRHLIGYARGVGASSPLYGRLLLAVADDPDLLALAEAARRDPDDRLWQRALIWPEHTARAENLRHALEIAQETPPHVVAGDALALLPGILDSVPEGATPCVFHTHAVYQFAPQDRDRLDALLVERSAPRDVVVRIGMEPYEDGHSVLSLSTYRYGRATKCHLADCDYHGAWLAWSVGSAGHT